MAKGKEKNPPAEELETDAPAAAPKKKGGGKLKLIIAAILGVIIIGGGGAFVGMKFLAGGQPAPAPAQAPEGEAAPPPSVPEEAPPIEDPAQSEEAAPSAEGGGGHGGEAGAEGAAEGAPAVPAGPQNIEFKPFVVNLNDGAGRRFLKMTMSVEAENQELADEINLKTPQFRDTILLLLSSLSFDDIATLDGKMRLRNQMLNRINTQLTGGKIKNIYFSEFVVQ